jgi:hypothetical protein
VRVSVHRRDDDALVALRNVAGVIGARWCEDEARSTLVLEVDDDRFEPWEIGSVLSRRGLLVLSSSAVPHAPVDFDRPPRLDPLPLADAVAALLRSLRGSRALPRLVRDHGGFGPLFVSLAERLTRVRCYRLSVGRLEDSLELIESLLGARDGRR